jgi:hypothetical protein
MIVGHFWRYSPRMTHDHEDRPLVYPGGYPGPGTRIVQLPARPGHGADQLANSILALRFNLRVASGCFRDDGIPGGRGAGAAFGPSGAGPGDFRWPGGCSGKRGQAVEIPADAAGGQPAGRTAAFPGPPAVLRDGAGEAEQVRAANVTVTRFGTEPLFAIMATWVPL